MAKATALVRARRVRHHPKPKPQSAQIGPDGPQHPGNRQLYDKRGRPDAGLRLHPHHATFNVATFCAALWSNFTLPLTGPLTTLRDARPETRFARMVLLKAREIGRMINYAAGARGVSGGGQKG